MGMQDELFDEFKNIETKKRPLGKGILPDKIFTLIFTYEKLTLVIIGFILTLALTFVVGFECGRKRVRVPRPLPKQEVQRQIQQTQEVKKNIPGPIKPYTIQIATFKSKQLALQEVEKFKKKGFHITVIGINGLYEVWVGEYSSRKEAEASQTFNVLRKTYRDCFVRER